MESLLGHLLHAAVVDKPGRIFLRHMFSLMAKVAMRHHFVHLDTIAQADLAWWDCLLQSWHGASFIIPNGSLSVHVPTDALGSLGGGALSPDGRWLQAQWPQHGHRWISQLKRWFLLWWRQQCTWGWTWDQHDTSIVFFHWDNAAMVAVIQNKSAEQPTRLHLLRCLYFFAAYYPCRGHKCSCRHIVKEQHATVRLSHPTGHPDRSVSGGVQPVNSPATQL